jgi:hypothetical protein
MPTFTKMVFYCSSTSLVFKFFVAQFKFLEQRLVKLGYYEWKWHFWRATSHRPAPAPPALLPWGLDAKD